MSETFNFLGLPPELWLKVYQYAVPLWLNMRMIDSSEIVPDVLTSKRGRLVAPLLDQLEERIRIGRRIDFPIPSMRSRLSRWYCARGLAHLTTKDMLRLLQTCKTISQEILPMIYRETLLEAWAPTEIVSFWQTISPANAWHIPCLLFKDRDVWQSSHEDCKLECMGRWLKCIVAMFAGLEWLEYRFFSYGSFQDPQEWSHEELVCFRAVLEESHNLTTVSTLGHITTEQLDGVVFTESRNPQDGQRFVQVINVERDLRATEIARLQQESRSHTPWDKCVSKIIEPLRVANTSKEGDKAGAMGTTTGRQTTMRRRSF